MSNIVIYEDDGPMRALLKEWLGDAGYRVLAFAAPAGRPAEGADLVITGEGFLDEQSFDRVCGAIAPAL